MNDIVIIDRDVNIKLRKNYDDHYWNTGNYVADIWQHLKDGMYRQIATLEDLSCKKKTNRCHLIWYRSFDQPITEFEFKELCERFGLKESKVTTLDECYNYFTTKKLPIPSINILNDTFSTTI